MDLDEELAPVGDIVQTEKLHDEKPKKRVVIDENNQIRRIENESVEKQNKPKSQFRQNMETTLWPWRISCMSFSLGFMFHVISYGSPYWITLQIAPDSAMHAGFWSACLDGSGCSFRNSTTGCANTVRGFGGMAVLFSIVVMFLLYFHSQKINNRRNLGLAASGFCFVSALSIQIAAAVFGQTDGCLADESGAATGTAWGWSLALAFVSVLLIVASGVAFLVLELRGISRDSDGKRAWNGRGVVVT